MKSSSYIKGSNAALLILTGILVGAIGGLLLAPEEGAETRKKLFKKAKKYKEKFEEVASDYKDKASDLKDDIGDAADKFKKKFY